MILRTRHIASCFQPSSPMTFRRKYVQDVVYIIHQLYFSKLIVTNGTPINAAVHKDEHIAEVGAENEPNVGPHHRLSLEEHEHCESGAGRVEGEMHDNCREDHHCGAQSAARVAVTADRLACALQPATFSCSARSAAPQATEAPAASTAVVSVMVSFRTSHSELITAILYEQIDKCRVEHQKKNERQHVREREAGHSWYSFQCLDARLACGASVGS